MKYRKMGRTGLKVSEICLGTMIYGDQVEEKRSIRIIRKALETGINFLDTADMYVKGKSEEIVGKAIRGYRDSIVLATKVAGRMGPGPNDAGLSRRHIMKAIEDSLGRLKTDYIDLYYAHLPDHETPLEETLRALDDLVHQGKVRYIACSNFRAWELCKALWVSDRYNLARFDCISSPYNLITRDVEYELLPLCASEGIGVTVYNPLAGGLLTGKHDPKKAPTKGTRFGLKSFGKMYYDRYWSDVNFEAVARLKSVASESGASLPQFALAWTLNNRTITTAVCGCSSLKQLEENLAAIELKLSPEQLAACDEVWQSLRPGRFFYWRDEPTTIKW